MREHLCQTRDILDQDVVACDHHFVLFGGLLLYLRSVGRLHRVVSGVLALKLRFSRDCLGRLWDLSAHRLAYLTVVARRAWGHSCESGEVSLSGAVALLWQRSLVVAIHRACIVIVLFDEAFSLLVR